MSFPEDKDATCEYVKATCDYEYMYKEQNVSMYSGEVFLLIKKSTNDWWQVIRKGETRPFYAPKQYLEYSTVPLEVMKSSLRKKLAHQRHLQHQQRIYEECKRERVPENEGVTNFVESRDNTGKNMSSGRTNKNPEQPLVVFNPVYQKDVCLSNDLIIDERQEKDLIKCEKTLHLKRSNDMTDHVMVSDHTMPTSDSFEEACELNSPERELNNSSYGMLSTSSELDCSSACTSFSSLNEYPLNYQSRQAKSDSATQQVVKAASCDVLQTHAEEIDKENIKQQRAASSEELDNKHFNSFHSNLLCHSSRSNSVDLKRCNNNLDLSTFHKFNSMEKQKFRLSKDPMNRRRSWALNENCYTSSFARHKIEREDPLSDADLPPKLPPKLKYKFNMLSRSTDNLNNLLPSTDKRSSKYGKVDDSKINNNITELESIAHKTNAKIPPKTLPRKLITGVTTENVILDNGAQVPEKFKDASKKVMQLQKEGKGKRVEELIEKLESKTKLHKMQPTNKIISQSPPSPDESPVVMLHGNWGKYIEKETRMPFYYNTVTGERRWKPPRRSAPSATNLGAVLEKKHEDTGSYRPTKSSSVSRLAPSTYAAAAQSHKWDQHSRKGSSKMKPVPTTATLPAKPTIPPIIEMPINSTFPGSTASLDKDQCSKCESPTVKQHKSLFSTISSSLSFMKSGSPNAISKSGSSHSIRSLTPPQVPASSLKPTSFGVTPESSPTEAQFQSMQSAVEQFQIPAGWLRKCDALSRQIYFHSLLTGEKWGPATDASGTLYFFPLDGGSSQWRLPDHGEGIMGIPDTQPATSPSLKDRLKSAKEDYISWCWYYREGKKMRKNWSPAWLQYFPEAGRTPNGKTYGILAFSKSPDERKKVDVYGLLPPCVMLGENGKTTSRENVIALKNGEGNIVLIQTKDEKLHSEWIKCFHDHNKIQQCAQTPDKERKSKKMLDKSFRRDSSDEPVSPSEKGLKDILLSFLKKRPMQETLVNKGIYKEAVFGSTIEELCTKDGTFIPLFVLKCINCIEKNTENFNVEGLYRIPGNAPRIQKIRFEIAQNRYAILEEEKDVHNLSGALKLFFRELKTPLVPFDNYQSFIQAAGSECLIKFSSRVDALKDALKKLPRYNHDTLKLLLEHLLKVNSHEKVNRMSLMNLAIVFGPCLLWPETTVGFDLMTDVMLQNRAVEALLSDFNEVYNCASN